MTKLSVNINKVAVLRNSRGGDVPSVVEAAVACERFGAQGITVHPRPDERHIRYSDVRDLKRVVTTEFNIEGNPREPRFVELVLDVRPTQVTLVPDAVGALTSNAGWDTVAHSGFLGDIVRKFRAAGIRVSVFVDPVVDMVRGAAAVGADRVELYTEAYAATGLVEPYVVAANEARLLGLGVNAGHDLNSSNLRRFAEAIPFLDEVSIGHALISEALYLGLENTIKLYLSCL